MGLAIGTIGVVQTIRHMDFFSEFKPIRNKMRKFDYLSLVEISRIELRSIKELKADAPTPWFILFVIKLAFVYGEDYSSKRKFATRSDFFDLYNAIWDLFKTSRFLADGTSGGLNKFMRLMAVQQFWAQKDPNIFPDLARQVLLFSDDKRQFSYSESFENRTGIKLTEFFELLQFVWVRFLDNKNDFISNSYFEKLRNDFSEDTINKFLDLLSLTPEQTRLFFKKDISSYNIEYQIYEQSLLLKKPLLKINDKYYSYGISVINESIRYFVYDFLKTNFREKFPEAFGHTMEKYLKNGIELHKIKYHAESDLKKLVPRGKSVDYAMEFESSFVLVESKAIETKKLSQINPTDEILSNEYRTSIIKGVKQAYSTANALNMLGVDAIIIEKKFYALIVSYKQLYLGTARTIWDEFIGKEVEEFLLEQNIEQSIIPPENIFIVSLDEYDKLIHILFGNNEHSLPELLEQFVKDNANSGTAFYNMEIRLHKIDPSHINLPYLKGIEKKLLRLDRN